MWDIARKFNALTWVAMFASVIVGLFSILVAFGFFSDKISNALSASSGSLSATMTNVQVNTGSWIDVPSNGNLTSQTIAMGTTMPFRFNVNNTGSVAINYDLTLEISFAAASIGEQAVLLIYPGGTDSATILANIANNDFTGAIIGPSLSDATAITTSTGTQYGLSMKISTDNVLDSGLAGGQTGATGAGGLSSRTHSYQLVFAEGGDAATNSAQYDDKIIEVSMQADVTAYSDTIAWTDAAQSFFRIASEVEDSSESTEPCPNQGVDCDVSSSQQPYGDNKWVHQFNPVTVTNTSSTVYLTWWVTFDVPADAVVNCGNSFTCTRSGNTITATGPSWNPNMLVLDPDESASFSVTITTSEVNVTLASMVVHYIDASDTGLSTISGLTSTANCTFGNQWYAVSQCSVTVTNNSGQTVNNWRFEADWSTGYSVVGFYCGMSYFTTDTQFFISSSSPLANGASATCSSMQLGGLPYGAPLLNYSVKGVL